MPISGVTWPQPWFPLRASPEPSSETRHRVDPESASIAYETEDVTSYLLERADEAVGATSRMI